VANWLQNTPLEKFKFITNLPPSRDIGNAKNNFPSPPFCLLILRNRIEERSKECKLAPLKSALPFGFTVRPGQPHQGSFAAFSHRLFSQRESRLTTLARAAIEHLVPQLDGASLEGDEEPFFGSPPENDFRARNFGLDFTLLPTGANPLNLPLNTSERFFQGGLRAGGLHDAGHIMSDA